MGRDDLFHSLRACANCTPAEHAESTGEPFGQGMFLGHWADLHFNACLEGAMVYCVCSGPSPENDLCCTLWDSQFCCQAPWEVLLSGTGVELQQGRCILGATSLSSSCNYEGHPFHGQGY